MAVLRTPDDVVQAVGPLRPDYADLVRYTDGSAGFSVKRPYPPGKDVGRVVARNGTAAITCLLRVVVDQPTAAGGVCRVSTSAAPYRLYSGGWVGSDYNHPNLTADAANQLRRARWPVGLDFNDEFLWDIAEHAFQNEAGQRVTGQEIFDFAYEVSCRTLSRRFRVRYAIQSAIRSAVQRAVWRGQDWCLWLLEHGYEIRLREKPSAWQVFHKYRLDEFQRQTDKEGTQFFGFQSSKRAFFTNTIVLALGCLAIYYVAPRFDLLRAVYANDALTTVALVFGFLIADQAVPLILKALVCGLSRLRERVLHVLGRVNP